MCRNGFLIVLKEMLLYSTRLFLNRRMKRLYTVGSGLFDKRRRNRKSWTHIQRTVHVMTLLVEHSSSQVDNEEDVVTFVLSVLVQTPSIPSHVESELPISILSSVTEPGTNEASIGVADRLPRRQNESSQ